MKFTSSVKSDLSEINNMMRRLPKIEEYCAEYGYFEGDIHQSSGLPITYLVATLAGGNMENRIPPRDFISLAEQLTDQHFEVSNKWKADIWMYLKGQGTIVQLYKEFGRIGEKYIQAAIDVGNWAQNVEWWREAKIAAGNSPSPLIETGEMYNSVRSKAVKIGEKT